VDLVILLVGCTPALDFAYERADAVCAWHERCGTLEAAGFTDESDCKAGLHAAVKEANVRGELDCPDYDQGAAEACVRAWEEVECGEQVEADCDGICQE
jgi:hypothetical protein